MSPDGNSKSPAFRIYSALIVFASVATAVLLLPRVYLNFKNQYFLTHVEGVWLACAYDFMHGVFYRPLFGPLGYGGTRYFPLYFVLTGWLSKPLGSLETAGIALSGVCVVLTLIAVFVLLRRMNVSTVLSVAAVTAILSVASTQQALLGAKGDSLAAAANLWGVVVCTGSNFRRRAIYIGAALFTLAFATKLTTVFGVAAVFVAWLLAKRVKEAFSWRSRPALATPLSSGRCTSAAAGESLRSSRRARAAAVPFRTRCRRRSICCRRRSMSIPRFYSF